MEKGEPFSKKRKISDFFATSPSKLHRSIIPETSPGSSAPSLLTAVPGITVIPNFVTLAEQIDILSFLSSQKWRTDLSRRTMHYGGTYCLLPPRSASPSTRKRIENDIITAPAIPDELYFLINRMTDQDIYKSACRPEYIIVNEYLSGHGISAHIENFRFMEPVCGLTLGDGDYIRFHELVQPDDGSVRTGKAQRAKRTGQRKDVWMPSRSLVVMRGDGRWKWQHEIVRGRKKGGEEWKRTSLTFRADGKSGNGGGQCE